MSEQRAVAQLKAHCHEPIGDLVSHALRRFGVYENVIDSLPPDLTADRIIREWLDIDRDSVKIPVGMLVKRLKHADGQLPQPTPKAIAAAWNADEIQAITFKSNRLENKEMRMRYNEEAFGLEGSELRIKRDEISEVVFE